MNKEKQDLITHTKTIRKEKNKKLKTQWPDKAQKMWFQKDQ